MTSNQAQDKLDRFYENKALRIILKEFRKIGTKIPFKLLTPNNARTLIDLSINAKDFEKALFKVHLTIAQYEGKLELARIAKYGTVQKFRRPDSYPLFSKALQKFLVDYYRENGGKDIVILTDTYKDAVIAEIQKAQEALETIDQLADRIMKAVTKPDFYRWQAYRIAVTETTYAVNAAREIAGEFATIIMQKEWVTRGDSRVRDSHIAINNTKVDADGYFMLSSGVKLKRPGDKAAFGYNTANSKTVLSELVFCRCRFNNRAKRDAEGNLIRKA